ncbi:hypothetical protein Neosp_001345 [[Neocosmospora] mangrovei]
MGLFIEDDDVLSPGVLLMPKRLAEKVYGPFPPLDDRTSSLNVGTEGDDSWKLRVIAEDDVKPAPYITLSYRWGTEPSLMLLKSNMDEFRRGKPIADLPQTFQDLITVTRHFSHRYVWIDALCIIQDSSQDWLSESVLMRDVYANSICTIAAAASSGPEGGLFRSRQPEQACPGVVNVAYGDEAPEDFYIWSTKYWLRHFDRNPGRNDQWGVFPDSLFLTWRVLVEEYSKRSLTKPTDKLVAFAGIAKLFQENTGDEYCAGLWRSRFIETLNWRVTTPGPAAVDYLAPSWSWASVQSPIEIEGRSTLGKGIKLVSVMAIETIKLESDATLGWDNPPDSIRIRSAPHVAEVHLDTSSGNWDGKEDLFLLPIILDPYGRAPERRFVYYLILKRHSTWANFYQRVGHCRTDQEVKGLGQTFTAKDIVEGIFEEEDFDEPIFGVTAQFSEISIV